MTPGARLTLRGQPLVFSAANAVLDVMLSPVSFEHAQRMSLLAKAKQPRAVESPSNISLKSRRGLLILKSLVPLGLSGARCAEQKLLTVGAVENVVRSLPV